jgi:flagellar protein FliL
MSEAEKASPPKKSKKGLIIAIAAVLVLGGGGGGAWFVMKGKAKDPAVAEAEAKKAAQKSRVFMPLDPFTVNLTGEEERFAQIALVLELSNNETSEEIKAIMPAVRNKLLLLLSSKQPRELLTLEGKQKLAIEIADHTGRLIGWVPAKKVKVKAPDPEKDPEAADGKSAEAAKEPDTEEETPKPKAKPNPVERVHFAQFIVQ